MTTHTVLTDGIEVLDLTVRIAIDNILAEASDEQLVEALKAKDYDGAAFLEIADADELLEALKDKSDVSLIDILDGNNALEAAARRFLDNLSPDDLQEFLVQFAYIPRPASELSFVADNPSDAVYWVKLRDPDYLVGMILPDLSNVFEGRAKLRMFVNTPDDSGWIDCETLAKAQRMARMLFAGRGASAGRDPAERLNIHLDAVIHASDRGPHISACPCSYCDERRAQGGEA